MSQSRHILRTSLALGSGALALVTLAACGSSGSASDSAAVGSGAAPSAQAGGAAQGSGQAGAFQGRNPGTSGQIAAKQGSTLQVQNQTDGQVAVSYTAKTAITAQVAATLKDVKVGSCVTVTPVMSASGGSTSSGTSSSALAAGTVRISAAVKGQCTGGFVGGAGGGFHSGSRPSGVPSGMATSRPSEFASGRPSGAAGGFRGGMMFANGKVTAVSGGGFTVANSLPTRGGSNSGSSTGASSNVQVTVSGSTTYTTTKSSDASALKVGKCVVATGQADSTGAVTADRLVVSDPVNGSCTSGFGFGGRGGQGGQGGQAGAAGQQGGAA